MIFATKTHSPSFVLSISIQTLAFSFNLGIKKAFISMSVALAAFTCVGSNVFARTPEFLIVHRTAFVTEGSASVMFTFALVFHSDLIDNTFVGMPIARTLTSNGNITKAVKISP